MEFGLLEEPSDTVVTDAELETVIREIRQDAPFSGVQMMCGSLRMRGIKVTRERVRSALRSIDPISGARRWPANIIRRRPYSVPGPNSLWHIGMH